MNLDILETARNLIRGEIISNIKLVNKDKAYKHLCVSANALDLCIKEEEKK